MNDYVRYYHEDRTHLAWLKKRLLTDGLITGSLSTVSWNVAGVSFLVCR
jgi:hypothetical protein